MEPKIQSKDNKRKRSSPTPGNPAVTRSTSRKLSNSSSDASADSKSTRVKLVVSKASKATKKPEPAKSTRLTRSRTHSLPKGMSKRDDDVSSGTTTKRAPPSHSAKRGPNKKASFADDEDDTVTTQFDEDDLMLYSDQESSDIDNLSEDDEESSASPNKRAKHQHLSFMPLKPRKDFYQLSSRDDGDNDDASFMGSDSEAEEEEEEADDMPNFHYESRYKAPSKDEDDYFASDWEDDENLASFTVKSSFAQPQVSSTVATVAAPIATASQESRSESPSPLDYYSLSDSVESVMSSPRDFDDLMSLNEPLTFVTSEDELESSLPSLTPLHLLHNSQPAKQLSAQQSQELLLKQEEPAQLLSKPAMVSRADEIAQRWSQSAPRERANSFSMMTNRQSFKQLARALAKRPHLVDTLNDTLNMSSASTSDDKAIEASLDQFFDLVDETMLSSTQKRAGAGDADASLSSSSSWATETQSKIPLCGYRYRNQSIQVPGRAPLNARKILAALASISSENEKLVASFPDGSDGLASSAAPVSEATVLLPAPVSPSASILASSSLSSAAATAATAAPSKTVGSQTRRGNAPRSSALAEPESPMEEITKSALEYYQQAVVASAGLNLHSLYSGKAREMISGGL